MSSTIQQPADTGAATSGAVSSMGAGEFSGRQASLASDAWRELRRNPVFIISAVLILLMVCVALFPGLFTNTDPLTADLKRSREAPSAEHWFGFDIQGRDYYTQVIFGARPSIFIGVFSTGLAALIAVLIGSLAGYYGRIADSLISGVTDIFFGMPYIFGPLVMLTALNNHSVLMVGLAITAFSWMTMARLMRSSTLSARDMDYVNAARALGASDRRIMGRHILPNAITPVMVYATVTVGITIVSEATLSFLGVGLQLPTISWGLQISAAQNYLEQAPHLLLFPGLFLSVTVLSFILLGDAVRDAFDPKLR